MLFSYVIVSMLYKHRECSECCYPVLLYIITSRLFPPWHGYSYSGTYWAYATSLMCPKLHFRVLKSPIELILFVDLSVDVILMLALCLYYLADT